MPKDEAKDDADFICFYRPSPTSSLHREADRGDAEAQAELGRLYFEGRAKSARDTEYESGLVVGSYTPAVEQDLTAAVKWLRKAANQGHADAKRLLETVLAKAKGVH